MKKVKVLCVCGSGTVTSSMIAEKIKDLLEEENYEVSTTEVNPGGVESATSSGTYDVIAFTSPVDPENANGVPIVSAIGLLTGMDEEGFLEEIKKVLEQV